MAVTASTRRLMAVVKLFALLGLTLVTPAAAQQCQAPNGLWVKGVCVR